MEPTIGQSRTDMRAAMASRVQGAIAGAANATGVDFNYLYAQARVESALNPNARARTSSATGLYQFIDQTWLATVDRHGSKHGLGWAANAISRDTRGRYQVADPATRAAILDLRRQPEAAAVMAAEFAADNRAHIEAATGRTAQPVDLYLAHFLGAGGAARFLAAHDHNPDAAAAPLLPAAAAANRSIFYDRDGRSRSLGEIRNRFAARFGETAPATASNADFGLPTTIALNRPAPEARSETLALDTATRASDHYTRMALITLIQLGEGASA
jgi:hypothetical protein